ncbi:hypothetical protein J4E83_000677 [Alternaria metachromatica]|uniref:uncharacterized protein n=1 Tax=Alternaria metachromatica TaxID=283354 RepID=UPI0020C3FB54|nr:uncharacterized protein J4E83_000677 [Alternaria metachromatica]KAI4637859.1 hypothetical protein J4E83_000677 [Alternaria metachromatica]
MSVSINFSPSAWQDPPSVHHPFLTQIREAASKYRLQSASHFNIPIDVCQAAHASNPDLLADIDTDFMLYVGFHNFGTNPIFAVCRPKIARRGRDKGKFIRGAVQVWLRNKFVPLLRFFEAEFPPLDGPVADEIMYQWWNANGRTFNWTGLPTEVKERILMFCMHRSPPLPIQKKSRGRVRQVSKGAPEVVGQLGKWASLLTVSHQVRTISLRLCFAGSSDLEFGNGLCIVAESLYSFKRSIRRLAKHRQLTEGDSIPTDDKSRELEILYNAFPQIYPHLDRFATFNHGIRKIYLQLSFIDGLNFFKVTAGSFAQHPKPRLPNYEVFETLPHLNELIFKLPDATGYLEDDFRNQRVSIFYGEPFNCPRTLHRLIYESAAKVLAPYKAVKFHGFMDEDEEDRFLSLRNVAKNELIITTEELKELYKDEAGGIELGENVIPGVEKEHVYEEEREIIPDDFWPPKCRCEILCREVLHPNSN